MPKPDVSPEGGAIVNHYQSQKMNQLSPRDEHHGIPKVYEELDASQLPYVNFPPRVNKTQIADYMHHYQIPILSIFHVGRVDFEEVITPVQGVGGKIILHQTIHWADDDVLKSPRLEEVDRIVAPTHFAKRVFQTVRKLPPDQISVIPHGVDTTRFYRHETVLRDKLGIKPHQKVILFSGRLSFWKGVQTIIPITRKLCMEYDCVFIVRGGAFWGIEESEKLAYLFERMARNNPNFIFIPEWKSPSFMEELYAFTDILISNTGHEGFNVPLIESQAVGAVPVTTAIPNHVEILGYTGERGLLLDPKVKVGEVNDGTDVRIADSDQVDGAIRWLLENPEEASIMGQRGVENVKERFELTKVAQQWLDLYDGLVPKSYSMDVAMKERLQLG